VGLAELARDVLPLHGSFRGQGRHQGREGHELIARRIIPTKGRSNERSFAPLRDRVRPPVRILFVGINPGIRSAAIGHHFAGYSNRFWKLLYDAGLVPEPIGAEDDRRLPEWGLGITNLIPRTTSGIDTLSPHEYVEGVRVLRRKVRRWRPEIVALAGVTIYRAIFKTGRPAAPVRCGEAPERFEGARVFVLPNPSGRNANFSYREMLATYRALARAAAPVPDRDASSQ
jgi:TDG/mug DNA glycosylase family protein